MRRVNATETYQMRRRTEELQGPATSDLARLLLGLATIHPARGVDLVVDEFPNRIAILDDASVVCDQTAVVTYRAQRHTEHSDSSLRGLNCGFRRRYCDPHWRMRILNGLWKNVSRRHFKIFPVPLELLLGPHLRNGPYDLIPHVLGIVGVYSKCSYLGPGRRTSGTKFEPAIGDKVKR